MEKAGFCFFLFVLFFAIVSASNVFAEKLVLQESQFPFFKMPGTLEGTGTHFELTDSKYLNLSIDSSEPIYLTIRSVPETIIMTIESASGASSADITISGFPPLTTYYKYEDNYHYLAKFTTDETGKYGYSQDISKKHRIFIQPRTSTRFIKDNETGGDCPLIGNWDYSTKTCTLTTSLTQTIQIDSDGITLDGAGNSVVGSKAGFGIFLTGKTGVTIKKLEVREFIDGIAVYESTNSNINSNDILLNTSFGIFLNDSNNNTVTNNFNTNNYNGGIAIVGHNNQITQNICDLSEGGWGISVNYSNNTLGENRINQNMGGITLIGAHENTLVNNDINSNGYFGVAIDESNNNKIYNNNFTDNGKLYDEGAQAVNVNSIGNVFSLAKPVGGNYWNDWNAPDADNDGFVDVPYVFLGGLDDLPHVKPIGVFEPGEEDIIPPVTTIALSGTIGNNGWFVSNVVASLTATDEGGTVALTEYGFDGNNWNNYTAPFTVSNNGTTIVYYRSIDGSGNVEPTESQEIKIDKTLPTINGAPLTEPDANGWYNNDVTVRFNCEDLVSGVVESFFDVVVSLEDANQLVSGTCEDFAGNTASTTVNKINLDKSPPSITGRKMPEPNANGWNNSDVTVQFECADNLSEIENCSQNSIVSTEGKSQSATGNAVDFAGNTATVTINEINIDKTMPEITIVIPTPNASYAFGTALDFSANDSLSGIEQTIGKLTDANSATQEVATGFKPAIGNYTLVVKAIDKAGNTKQSNPITFNVYSSQKGSASGNGFFTPDSESNLPRGISLFSFTAKYDKKGKLTGNLEFNHIGFNFSIINFNGKTIDWLTITGSTAQFQGTGTIRGRQGTYTFRVTATDNGKKKKDFFDIKIWKGTNTQTEPLYKAKNTITLGDITVKNNASLTGETSEENPLINLLLLRWLD